MWPQRCQGSVSGCDAHQQASGVSGFAGTRMLLVQAPQTAEVQLSAKTSTSGAAQRI